MVHVNGTRCRTSVTFRKVINGFRSAWGTLTHARTRSVIGTGRLNDIPAHQAISRALAGQPSALSPQPRLTNLVSNYHG